MSKIGQANLALTNDDMGEPPVFELIDSSEVSAYDVEERLEAERLWELSKYTVEELKREIDRREDQAE